VEILAAQRLPHSLGLLYEELTEHLGFLRSSDEYKVMALASHGRPRHLDQFRELVTTTGDGGFVTERWTGRRTPRPGTGMPIEADPRRSGRQRAGATGGGDGRAGLLAAHVAPGSRC
jgi:carbamoyltransferase